MFLLKLIGVWRRRRYRVRAAHSSPPLRKKEASRNGRGVGVGGGPGGMQVPFVFLPPPPMTYSKFVIPSAPRTTFRHLSSPPPVPRATGRLFCPPPPPARRVHQQKRSSSVTPLLPVGKKRLMMIYAFLRPPPPLFRGGKTVGAFVSTAWELRALNRGGRYSPAIVSTSPTHTFFPEPTSFLGDKETDP